jgi:putative flippase GtrA
VNERLPAFIRFGTVGVVGFAVDATILALLLLLGMGFYWGRACSYVAAASCTWAINRSWAFQDRSRRRARQWAQFLAVNSIGGAVNYSVYALIVSHLGDAFLMPPVLAVAAGSICGLAINFLLSIRLVFVRGRPEYTRQPQRTEM